MKILVTGGLGFQGGHLSEALLSQGHDVTILNTYSEVIKPVFEKLRDRTNIVFGSITDQVIVDKTVRGQDVVFHLAANVNVDQSLKDPRGFIDCNIIGTHLVLEAVRKYNARMIHASTCEVYGDGHDIAEDELLTESSTMSPNSPYAASKLAAERWCISYNKSFDTDVTIVRPFNIFGERQKSGQFGALIPILVKKALNKEPLTVFGDGKATRDYLYISDLVDAYMLVLNHPELSGLAINFASGINTSVIDIAEYISKKLDSTIEKGPARPGEVSRFPADVSLSTSLGFKPKVNIWEGIDLYIKWAKENKV